MRKKSPVLFCFVLQLEAIKPEGFGGKKVLESYPTWMPVQHGSYVREKSVRVLHKQGHVCLGAHT